MIIIVLFAFVSIRSFGQQNINLSFEAQHYEGQHVHLDSTKVINLSRNCDTTIYSPDTILSLPYYVGILETEIGKPFELIDLYPNPSRSGSFLFSIKTGSNINVFISVVDQNGRLVLNKEDYHVIKGKTKFQLETQSHGLCFLMVETESFKISKKLFSIGEVCAATRLTRIATSSNFKKQINSQNPFWFIPGDTLWCIGYSISPEGVPSSDIIEVSPKSSTHYLFTVFEGMPCDDCPGVMYGDYLYPTVKVESQCWLKENLQIGNMISGDSAMKDDGIIEKYCYDNLQENCEEYGGLYQWNELMQYTEKEGTQGICPEGWRVATDDDYLEMIYDHSGPKCVERGDLHWLPSYNANATNEKGWTARAGGFNNFLYNKFEFLKMHSSYYSSTKMDYDWVWYIEFNKNGAIFFGTAPKFSGHSVRCIQNN